jgi:hypothetical protein
MKTKIAIIVALLAAVPLFADDTPKLPPSVAAINVKYDKQAEIAQHAYWKAILAAQTAKLKQLQDAMVTAAQQKNADAIPVLEKEIEDTKAGIAEATSGTGVPAASTAADFKWLEGTSWHLERDAKFELTFNADHTLSGGDRGIWKVLDGNTIALKREHIPESIWTFSKSRKQAMDEVPSRSSEAGSLFLRNQ